VRLVRNPDWTWKTDLAWLFWHLPRALLWWLRNFVLTGLWRRCELGFWGSFSLALGLADAWAGRWYRLVS